MTLIDARPGHHRVLGHVVIPGASADSIEQPQWNPGTSTFVEAIRSTKDFPNGEVVQIDPKAIRLQSVFPVDETCNPGGLAVGPKNQALLGCNVGAPALVSLATGRVLHVYSGHDASGADEVAYDAEDHRYYAAEAGAVGPPPNPQLNTPTVMVIDAHSRRFVTDIALGPTAPGFHQVTALFSPGRVYVPQSDGIHVYTSAAEDAGAVIAPKDVIRPTTDGAAAPIQAERQLPPRHRRVGAEPSLTRLEEGPGSAGAPRPPSGSVSTWRCRRPRS